ncbi:hypothetical protein CapIbe_002324 [Capra ibex]
MTDSDLLALMTGKMNPQMALQEGQCEWNIVTWKDSSKMMLDRHTGASYIGICSLRTQSNGAAASVWSPGIVRTKEVKQLKYVLTLKITWGIFEDKNLIIEEHSL